MAALADHEMMRNQTATFSGGTGAVPARPGWTPNPRRLAALAVVATGLLLGGGCGKSNEPKITGNRSAGPVTLACAWQSGYSYLLRMDTEIVTETEAANPQNSDRHRVTFSQECLVRVKNAPRGGNLDLEVEITVLEMERAKNEGVVLTFNSERGGESVDDMGYIPVLKKLVGGRLRFSISPSGKVVRFEGIPEWLNNALGSKSTTRSPTTARVKTLIQNPPGPPGGRGTPAPVEVLSQDITSERVQFVPGPRATNVPSVLLANTGRVFTATGRVFTAVPPNMSRPASTAPSGAADTVARTLRGFFNNELFRTMLEFHFLPTAPVRVGDEWKEQGDTPISGRSSRVKYNAQCTFRGWQVRGGTNCARIDAVGKATVPTPPGNAARKGGSKSGLDGTVWINTDLSFPAATILDKESALPGDTNTRRVGTNSVTTTSGPKYVREYVSVTLLKATPPEAAAASAESSP